MAKNSTTFVGKIEYNEYPPPPFLLKAMERRFALPLISNGAIRIQSISYFHTLENRNLGDPNEGKGLFTFNGRPMQTSYGNEVFVWCTALPDTSNERLLAFSEKYDTIIKIESVEIFLERLLRAIIKRKLPTPIHCGRVVYNRGIEVTKDVLNNQKWAFNIFQKDTYYQHQNEYRFSLTNVVFKKPIGDYIDLQMGNCSDIISITNES